MTQHAQTATSEDAPITQVQTDLTLFFPQTEKSYDVTRRLTIAGISETCELILPRFLDGNTKIISRRHFKIEFIPAEGYFIEDLHSLNGTWLNRIRLEPYVPHFLRDGDQIILANQPEFAIEVVLSGGTMTEKIIPPSPGHEKVQGLLSGIYYDVIFNQFIVNGHRVDPTYFSHTEHKVLQYLVSQPGRIRSYDDLAFHVWNGYVQNNTIAKTVGNIRRKLEAISPGASEYIQTIRGRGFRCKIG